MRIIKTKKFSKWATKSKISDSDLVNTAKEIELGVFEANYGSGVLKKGFQIKDEERVVVQEL